MNSIVVTDRKFLTEYRNGETFATNPTSDYVPYFQGNVFENMRLDTAFEVATIFELTDPADFIAAIDFGTHVKLIHPFANWDTTEGFSIGDTVLIECNGLSTTETVYSIAGVEMFVTDTAFFATLGISSGDNRNDMVIKVTSAPTGLIFKFGLVPNATTANTYTSLLDAQQQVYSVNSKTSSPTYTTLNYLASESSNLGGVQYTYDGVAADGYTFSFTVRHTFRIPHFIQSWLSNVLGSTIPTLFNGIESLRYVSNINFSNNILDPNNSKVFIDDFQLGSVGFISQNFNTGVPVYSLTASEIQISSVVVTKPDINEINSFTASITRSTGNFSASEKVYLYISRLTPPTEYSDNSSTFDENFNFDKLAVLEGAAAANSTILKTFTAAIDGGDASIMDLTFTVDWSASDAIDFTTGSQMVLVASIGEIALDADLDNRQLIEIYAGSATKNLDVTGLITNFDLSIWPTKAAGITAQNIDTWNNRAFEMTFDFDLQKDADSNYAMINSLTYKMVAYNPTTNEFFKLDEFVFPISPAVTMVDGTEYQIINVDTERFLSVPPGDTLREVQVEALAPGSYAATQSFTGKIGFIVPWREWIENVEVPTSFYDATLADEFYNQNTRTSNYSGVDGYVIDVFLIANLSYQTPVQYIGGELATFDVVMHSNSGVVSNFDDDPGSFTWTAVTSVFDDTGDELDNILTSGLNTVTIVMSMPTAGAISPQGLIGEICMERINNTGSHFRLSSEVDYTEERNPLQPVSGQSFVTIAVDGGANTITLECDIDGTRVEIGESYNIYGHLRVK